MNIRYTVCGALFLITTAAAALAWQAAPPKTVAQKTAGCADKVKEVVVDTAKTVASKTKDGLSKAGEVMTDAWITTRVHERFVGIDVLKDSDISVDSSQHVVTLKGTVLSRAGRTKAASVALGTEGVRRVVNKLSVGPKLKK